MAYQWRSFNKDAGFYGDQEVYAEAGDVIVGGVTVFNPTRCVLRSVSSTVGGAWPRVPRGTPGNLYFWPGFDLNSWWIAANDLLILRVVVVGDTAEIASQFAVDPSWTLRASVNSAAVGYASSPSAWMQTNWYSRYATTADVTANTPQATLVSTAPTETDQAYYASVAGYRSLFGSVALVSPLTAAVVPASTPASLSTTPARAGVTYEDVNSWPYLPPNRQPVRGGGAITITDDAYGLVRHAAIGVVGVASTTSNVGLDGSGTWNGWTVLDRSIGYIHPYGYNDTVATMTVMKTVTTTGYQPLPNYPQPYLGLGDFDTNGARGMQTSWFGVLQTPGERLIGHFSSERSPDLAPFVGDATFAPSTPLGTDDGTSVEIATFAYDIVDTFWGGGGPTTIQQWFDNDRGGWWRGGASYNRGHVRVSATEGRPTGLTQVVPAGVYSAFTVLTFGPYDDCETCGDGIESIYSPPLQLSPSFNQYYWQPSPSVMPSSNSQHFYVGLPNEPDEYCLVKSIEFRLTEPSGVDFDFGLRNELPLVGRIVIGTDSGIYNLVVPESFDTTITGTGAGYATWVVSASSVRYAYWNFIRWGSWTTEGVETTGSAPVFYPLDAISGPSETFETIDVKTRVLIDDWDPVTNVANNAGGYIVRMGGLELRLFRDYKYTVSRVQARLTDFTFSTQGPSQYAMGLVNRTSWTYDGVDIRVLVGRITWDVSVQSTYSDRFRVIAGMNEIGSNRAFMLSYTGSVPNAVPNGLSFRFVSGGVDYESICPFSSLYLTDGVGVPNFEWLRVRYTGNGVVRFYTSDDDGATWILRFTDTIVGAGPIDDVFGYDTLEGGVSMWVGNLRDERSASYKLNNNEPISELIVYGLNNNIDGTITETIYGNLGLTSIQQLPFRETPDPYRVADPFRPPPFTAGIWNEPISNATWMAFGDVRFAMKDYFSELGWSFRAERETIVDGDFRYEAAVVDGTEMFADLEGYQWLRYTWSQANGHQFYIGNANGTAWLELPSHYEFGTTKVWWELQYQSTSITEVTTPLTWVANGSTQDASIGGWSLGAISGVQLSEIGGPLLVEFNANILPAPVSAYTVVMSTSGHTWDTPSVFSNPYYRLRGAYTGGTKTFVFTLAEPQLWRDLKILIQSSQYIIDRVVLNPDCPTSVGVSYGILEF